MKKQFWFESLRNGKAGKERGSLTIFAPSFPDPSVLWIAAALAASAAAFLALISLHPEAFVPASTIGLGVLAGLHGASYGAYKDSPFESFLARRFVRELVIASLVAAGLVMFHLAEGETPFILFVSTFTLTRIITEFWKLFVRTEPQDDFRIPTQFHCVKGIVHNRFLRLLAGAGFLGAIYGSYCLFKLLPHDLPPAVTGLIVGGGFGLVEAIAGAYKDGSMEGFYFRKFLKSPTFGALGGLIASFHTHNLAFLLLAAYGTSRMFLELLFKILVRDYSPGKFSTTVGSFPQWTAWKRHFLVPYTATWMLYVIMLLR